jgi:hypothetical protein
MSGVRRVCEHRVCEQRACLCMRVCMHVYSCMKMCNSACVRMRVCWCEKITPPSKRPARCVISLARRTTRSIDEIKDPPQHHRHAQEGRRLLVCEHSSCSNNVVASSPSALLRLAFYVCLYFLSPPPPPLPSICPRCVQFLFWIDMGLNFVTPYTAASNGEWVTACRYVFSLTLRNTDTNGRQKYIGSFYSCRWGNTSILHTQAYVFGDHSSLLLSLSLSLYLSLPACSPTLTFFLTMSKSNCPVAPHRRPAPSPLASVPLSLPPRLC